MTETKVINNIKEALQELGVTENTLSPQEKETLDKQGYLVLPGQIDKKGLVELREAFERLMTEKQSGVVSTARPEQGTCHIDNLINRESVFDRIYTNPKLLAAVYHVLGDEFKLSSLTGRDPLPGYGQQGLHNDWGPRGIFEPFYVVNSIWLLDDFTAENGPTRFVRGSHLTWQQQPPKAITQPLFKHPDEVSLIAPAGSVAIFNAHLWHSGTLNRSKQNRRAVFALFTSREQRRYTSIHNSFEANVFERLSSAARYLLG